MWVAIFGGAGNVWTARVGEAENFGDLVETFADGVVAGGSDDFKMIVTFHVDNLSVATGDNGGDKWKFWLIAAEPVSVDMRFEVMSRIEWLVVEDGERAGGESADEEAAD